MTKTIRLLLALVLALSPALAAADTPTTAPVTGPVAVAQGLETPQTSTVPPSTTAEAPAVPAVPAPVLRAGPDDGRRTMRRLPANLGRGAVGVVSGKNVVPFLAGGVVAAGSTFLDEEVRRTVDVEAFSWGSAFETGGGPIYSTIFVAGMFTAGRFVHGTRFRATTYDMLDSAIVNFAYTEVLKVAVGRERPNGQDNKSFPSGHTSNAFTLATVAQVHYGWKVGVPAYVLAGLMGASRIDQDKHWLSDVVAGAVLGTVVGLTVVRVNSRALASRTGQVSLSVSPILAHHARGVQVSAVF
jgi:membrane-associated phospholipid phosphatase